MLSRLPLIIHRRSSSIAVCTIFNAASLTPARHYSGGHKESSPQGASYVSPHPEGYHPHRPEMIALENDVNIVSKIMEKVIQLETILEQKGSIENAIETHGQIKKLITSHPFVDCLARLESAQDQAVWGLSMKERQMVSDARKKVNQS